MHAATNYRAAPTLQPFEAFAACYLRDPLTRRPFRARCFCLVSCEAQARAAAHRRLLPAE